MKMDINEIPSAQRPSLALFAGDPAGIGPELIEALLRDELTLSQANIVLIGHESLYQTIGLHQAILCHRWHGQAAKPFTPSLASVDNGEFMLNGLREALQLFRQGEVQALCFAPLNKGALRLGGMTQEDELRWFADQLNYTGPCGELNVLENLWTSRVTSHVALKDVSELLTPEKVANAIQMIFQALKASGKSRPRLAVCGLNPHNGDNGNYGDEEARIIAPGVALAAQRGYFADGPFPADTAFVRAIRKDGGYDGVVTMYHDQGQIAMKLMGFEKGVTVQGGLPVPITTPAHGTAYDIVGKGIANPGAMKNAFKLAVAMAKSARMQHSEETSK